MGREIEMDLIAASPPATSAEAAEPAEAAPLTFAAFAERRKYQRMNQPAALRRMIDWC